ncbi:MULTISPECIES: extracellular solute-binding protein [Cohnella]|uniref:extracellular solute-binding protein n=1 Tax=Cohnella TaxID=329857 RepID=UPI0009BA5F03|nr:MULTISPECIES: extracellular solute-binding protein [Cohnella]MBN2982444.1 extracellular solute-binding protein [Cohnella algarum]
MKHALKKWLSVSLILTSLAGLAACAGSENGQPSVSPSAGSGGSESSPAATETEPVGKYEPAITVTMGRDQLTNTTFREGDSLDNNIWTRELMDEYGIQIKNLWVTDSAGYWEKLNLTISSGELPDFFQVRPAQLKELHEAGMLADLTELYETHATPLTKEKLNEDGGVGLQSATIDGKLMGLPYVTAAIDNSTMLWIRKDWLDNLGLSEPQSMDDVIEIARAFKNDDPDQNGKNDTTGLGLTQDLFGAGGGLAGFFNGFHAYTNIWIENEAGDGLVNGLVQPEMKQALAKLQEMYKEGLLDTEFSAKSGIGEDVIAGKVGMFFGTMSQPLNPLQQTMDKDPSADWQFYPIPSIDGEPAKPQVSYNPPVYFVASKTAEHPAAIVKMMNLFAEKFFGETADPQFNYDGEHHSHKYQVVRTYGAKKNLNNHLQIKEAFETGSAEKLNPEQQEHYKQIQDFNAGDKSMWKYAKIFGPEGSLSLVNRYIEQDLLYSDRYVGLPTDLMVDNGSILSDLAATAFTKIIMGEPIESFDKFVKEWNDLGGAAITQEVNGWYKNSQ